MARTRRPLPAALAGAARRLEAWRRRRPTRVIPPDLWRGAVDLAGRFGVSATSNALRLDYYGLQRRVRAARRTSGAPAFVEIGPTLSSSSTECVVDVEDARGTKLRVHLKGVAVRDLAEMAERLLRRRG